MGVHDGSFPDQAVRNIVGLIVAGRKQPSDDKGYDFGWSWGAMNGHWLAAALVRGKVASSHLVTSSATGAMS